MTTTRSPELLEVDAKEDFKSLPLTEVEEKLGSSPDGLTEAEGRNV